MMINSSRLDTFQKCNRLYYWQSVFEFGGASPGIRPQHFNDDQKLGEVVHLGLAAFYRGEGIKTYREGALKALDFDALSWDRRNTWLDNLEWVDRLLAAYETWAKENDDFEVIDVERPGFVVLGAGCWHCGEPYSVEEDSCPACHSPVHTLAFITDLLVSQSGAVKVVDHKTAKSASGPYLASWHYSMQLWGYSYGRMQDHPVVGYGVNILRKLKTVGEPEQTMRRCPECHDGKRKKLACDACEKKGQVKKENNPSEHPFQREWESFDNSKVELLLRNRLRTIQDIERETSRFDAEPDAAFPMNTTHCFTYGVCPMLKLCWDWGLRNAEKWYEPPIYMLDQFDPQPDDYITTERLRREEQT